MEFHKLKFTQPKSDDVNAPFDYPWLETKIPRLIFKDCSIQIVLEELYFQDYGAGKVKPPKPTAALTAQIEVTGKLNEFHEGAYNHFIQNAPSYEKRLLDYFFTKTEQNIATAIAAEDTPKLRAFIKKHGLDTPEGVKKQTAWSGITLYDHGWDVVGLITMDFDCGWDEEHGLSILMHRDKIIAEGGLAEFTNRGDGLIDAAKYNQSYTTGYDIVLP